MSAPSSRDWPHVSLGSLAEFRNGLNYSKKNFGRGLKVINVKDFGDRLLAPLGDLDEINPDGLLRDDDLLSEGDILFVRSNGNRELIGRSVFVQGVHEPVSHSAFTIKNRFVSPEALPRFYAYLFRSTIIRQVLSAHGGGTNISNLNQSILSNLRVPLPPLAEQARVVEVLSAYDDLIENNTRRIAILEEMARALYREWFVEFRFPGNEGVRMVESAVGPIPEGWKIGTVREAIDIDPSTRVPREGEKPFVPMGSLSTDSMLIISTECRNGNSGSKFMNGDTLFARITPCLENGKTAFVQFLPSSDSVAFGSTEFIVMRSKSVTPEFVYLLARSERFRDHAIKSMSGATGRQRVQVRALSDFPIVIPPTPILTKFGDIISSAFAQVWSLAERNDNLRRTRDFVLPVLVSGRQSIDNSEKIDDDQLHASESTG